MCFSETRSQAPHKLRCHCYATLGTYFDSARLQKLQLHMVSSNTSLSSGCSAVTPLQVFMWLFPQALLPSAAVRLSSPLPMSSKDLCQPLCCTFRLLPRPSFCSGQGPVVLDGFARRDDAVAGDPCWQPCLCLGWDQRVQQCTCMHPYMGVSDIKMHAHGILLGGTTACRAAVLCSGEYTKAGLSCCGLLTLVGSHRQ
jgi:hypothetical protein